MRCSRSPYGQGDREDPGRGLVFDTPASTLIVGVTDATEAWRSLDARAESVAEPPADA
jgi:hypothetical protein